jgi:hypothetical protein
MTQPSNYSPAARAKVIAVYGLSAALLPVTVADIAGLIPAGGTGADAGCYDTANNRNTAITTANEAITVWNAALAKLNTMGLPITVT